jgi:2-alkenal reductase
MNNISRKRGVLPLLIGLLVVTSLACGSFVSLPQQPPAAPTPVEASVPVPQAPASTVVMPQVAEEDQVLVDLYSRVNPSVVNITIYASNGEQMMALGQGSGFVYDTNGDIITNAHVVHGAEQIEVTFYDGLTRVAELIGEDLHSDLAVVRVDLPDGVQALPLGDMNSLAVGQTVVAIGNPFGLSGTLTRGIISALGRTIPALTIFSIPQAIQTDAAINPGNSGGPLLNLNGEVIGVNAQIETNGTSNANIGVGFAVPVSIIHRVAPALVENGEYVWAWLGVRGGDLNPSIVKAMNLPVEQGAYLVEVVEGGPSAKAGLRGANDSTTVDGRPVDIGGDVVIAIDGQPVKTFDDMLIYVALNTSPGQQVVLTVLRDGQQQDFTVTLEPRPSE